jgi:hypothetical protein
VHNTNPAAPFSRARQPVPLFWVLALVPVCLVKGGVLPACLFAWGQGWMGCLSKMMRHDGEVCQYPAIEDTDGWITNGMDFFSWVNCTLFSIAKGNGNKNGMFYRLHL